jgi:hypothetical protein
LKILFCQLRGKLAEGTFKSINMISKAIIAFASISVLSVSAVIASFSAPKSEPVVQTIPAEEGQQEIAYTSSVKEVPAPPPAQIVPEESQPVVKIAPAEEGEKIVYASSIKEEPSVRMSDFTECFIRGSEDCALVSEENNRKYIQEAVDHPEVAGTYSGPCDGGTLYVKISPEGWYEHMLAIGDQPVDFTSVSAVHGMWRVADGELIARSSERNCDFRPRALKISENGNALIVPGLGCTLRKQ